MSYISQVVDYLFYLIYGLISLQISLDLLGARRGNGFRDFIETVCAPLLAPFKGLMPSVGSGGFQFRLSYVFALVAYSVTPHGDQRIVEIIGEPKDGDLKKCRCGVLTTNRCELPQRTQLKLWRSGAIRRPARNH